MYPLTGSILDDGLLPTISMTVITLNLPSNNINPARFINFAGFILFNVIFFVTFTKICCIEISHIF